MKERLQKIIAAAGLVAPPRRGAHQTGQRQRRTVTTLGAKAEPEKDAIRTLRHSSETTFCYIALHKPARGHDRPIPRKGRP